MLKGDSTDNEADLQHAKTAQNLQDSARNLTHKLETSRLETSEFYTYQTTALTLNPKPQTPKSSKAEELLPTRNGRIFTAAVRTHLAGVHLKLRDHKTSVWG